MTLLNIGFTGTILYLFLRTGSEPTTLIAAWFVSGKGELRLLAGITETKMKEGEPENEY